MTSNVFLGPEHGVDSMLNIMYAAKKNTSKAGIPTPAKNEVSCVYNTVKPLKNGDLRQQKLVQLVRPINI